VADWISNEETSNLITILDSNWEDLSNPSIKQLYQTLVLVDFIFLDWVIGVQVDIMNGGVKGTSSFFQPMHSYMYPLVITSSSFIQHVRDYDPHR